MEIIFCVLIGILFAIGVYLLISSNIMRILFGFITLSSAINLLIFITGRLNGLLPAFIKEQQSFNNTANALPQALLLTAIVISFGLLAYSLVLIRATWQTTNTLNSDKLVAAERDGELS